MGRSVMVPSNAVATVYIDVSEYDSDTWSDFVEDLRNVTQEKYKTFDESDRWTGREERAIAENGHSLIVVCEYSGLASVSLVPKDEYYDHSRNTLAAAWCARVAATWQAFMRKRYETYRHLATASNGEGFYEKV